MMWLKSLNPFEVREVLQAVKALQYSRTHLSIPLKSGKCCKKRMFGDKDGDALNPFEVREVLQVLVLKRTVKISLNPFEVREVLQAVKALQYSRTHLSIPLKSGKCCKKRMFGDKDGDALNPFEVREVLQV